MESGFNIGKLCFVVQRHEVGKLTVGVAEYCSAFESAGDWQRNIVPEIDLQYVVSVLFG